MEKNPSLVLLDDPPPLRAVPPSLVQRTARALLASALLGGALAVGSEMPADSAAQDPAKEERKKEDPLLVKLRQEFPPLIADLDSDVFRVRERAQRRLEQIALGWVREKQQVFPLITSLTPKGGYSLEQQRRLGKILTAHEGMELQLLWRPTIFREPPEWKERKDPPTAREVLAALEKQTGQKISLDSQGIAEGVVTDKFDGRTFWEVLEQAGKKCMVHQGRHDGTLWLWADAYGTRTTSGNILGQAHLRHCHPFDQTRQINVQFLLEPALLPGGAFITKADGVTDKGRKVACDVDEWGSVTLPFEEGEQSIDLTVTACIRGYEGRVEKVDDLTKEIAFPVRGCTFQICRKAKTQEKYMPPWGVRAKLLGEADDGELWSIGQAMQCRAFDAKGNTIAREGCVGSASDWEWHFQTEPYSLELTLPGRMTTAEKTLTFKGIPLN